MPKASPQQIVFEGELSPLAQARTDMDRYNRGMRFMRNMVPCRTGPAIGRSGTMFEQRAAYADKYSNLIPFVFNEDETLQMEFGHQKIRFLYEYGGVAAHREVDATAIVTISPLKITFPGHDFEVGEYVILDKFAGSRCVNNSIGRVTAVSGDDVTFGDGDIICNGSTGALSGDEFGAVVYEVATPYDHEDVRNIRAVQNLNTVYLFCTKADGSGDYRIQVLRRYNTFNWTLTEYLPNDGPYLDVNATTTVLKPSGNGTWVPNMTGATAPSGAASASSEGSGHEAWRAFDDDPDTYWEGKLSQEGWLEYAFETAFSNSLPKFTSATNGSMTISATSDQAGARAWNACDRTQGTDWKSSGDLPQEWYIDLGAGQTVRELVLRASRNREEFAPRDFTLDGSNTGTSGPWTNKLTKTGVTWKSGQRRQWNIASPTSFRYWRIRVTKVNRITKTTIIPKSGKKGKKNFVPRRTVTTKTDNKAGFSEVKLSYAAGTPKVVDGYTIYLGRYAKGREIKAHAPKTWVFEGYDGSSWEKLDVQQGYDSWGNYRSEYFPLQNEEPYLKYRIRIKEVGKEGNVTPRIGKLTLSSPDAPTFTLEATSKEGINDNQGFLSTDVGRSIRLKDADNTWRWARIGSVTDETTIGLDLVSDDPLVLDKKVQFWRLGLWSDTTGWPCCGTIHEDRLWCGGPSGYPDHIVGSVSGNHLRFVQISAREVVQDTHAIVLRCASKYMSRIAWLKSSQEALMVGTGLQEFILTTPVDEALTARNAKVRPTTARGSSVHEPAVAGNHVLFLSKSGRALYDYSWEPSAEGQYGAYQAPLISVLGAHLMEPLVEQLVFQEEPHGVIWARRSDGSVVGMTFNPENGVFGGHRHDFADGVVEALSVSPSPTDRQDSLWMVVKRTIDGQTVRYIERLIRFWDYGDILEEDAHFVDSGLRYLDAGTTNTLYGLRHLEGEYVSVLADNVAYNGLGPVTDGTLALPETVENAVVGKQMTREGEIIAPDSGSADGTARGKMKRPHSVVLALWETAGGEVGRFNEDQQVVEYTPIDYRVYGEDVPEETLKTVETQATVLPMGHDQSGTVRFRQQDPLPMNVVAVYPQLVTSDDR